VHDAQVQSARHHGLLRPGSFVSLRRRGARSRLAIQDLGDAEALLSSRRNLGVLARSTSVDCSEDWGGWLGRFQAAIAVARRNLGNAPERDRPDDIPRGHDLK